jgi:hypothetical protein
VLTSIRTLIGNALVVSLLGACGGPGSSEGPSAVPTPGPLPAGSATQPGRPDPSTRPPSAPPPVTTSTGWVVTVYYTAVERFHTDAAERVTGCPKIDCSHGNADLGSYPASFVKAVKDEGTGRTTAGRYLNWSYDTGYWLDDAPRDTAGRPLRPFESAAADPSALGSGTRFSITACGTDDDGGRLPDPVCTRLKAGRWVITDEFTPGLGGNRHLDVYLGEETGPRFTDSDWYTTLHGATLTLQG